MDASVRPRPGASASTPSGGHRVNGTLAPACSAPAPAQDVAARALRGSAIGLVNVGLGIGTTVATVPLVLRQWDQGTYALWLAVFAVYSLLQTIDTGHTGYLGNEFLRLAHGDQAAYRRVYASGLRMAVLLGAAQALLAAAVLGLGLVPRVLGIPLVGRAATDAGSAIIALAIGWWASGSFGGVIAGLYFPGGEFVRAQWWAIANRLLMFGCLVVPALAGFGVLGAAVATGAGNVVFGLLLLVDARRRFPIAREWRGNASWSEAARNVRRSLVVSANNACTQLGSSGLVLAVAALLGAAAVPAFTTLRTLTNAAAAVTTIAVNPIVPDMVRFRVQGEWAKLRASLEACWFGVGVVVQVGVLATLPVVEALYRGWTRGRVPFAADVYAALAAAIGVAALGFPALRYLQAMNRLGAQTRCNVAFLAVLAPAVPLGATLLGPAGVALALVLAESARTASAVREVAAEAAPAEARRLLRAARSAALPLVVTGGGLALAAALPGHRTAISALDVAALVPIFVFQWRDLEPALRDRVRRLVPRRARLRTVY